jgi:hypothetical protein
VKNPCRQCRTAGWCSARQRRRVGGEVSSVTGPFSLTPRVWRGLAQLLKRNSTTSPSCMT